MQCNNAISAKVLCAGPYEETTFGFKPKLYFESVHATFNEFMVHKHKIDLMMFNIGTHFADDVNTPHD